MITCVYGAAAAPFVKPAVDGLRRAAAGLRQEIRSITIEEAIRSPTSPEGFERVYVLPFDIPADCPDSLPNTPAELLAALFPNAEIINDVAVHERSCDKIAITQRLLERGITVPETLITSSPAEATDFIRRNRQAILKEPRSCGGQGHLVVLCDDSGAIIGEAQKHRYVVELDESAADRRLSYGVLSYPPPFFLQRLVSSVRRDGVLRPAQVLRAYVIEGAIPFWTERYRERIHRPADFIVSQALGAKVRFLQLASHAADRTARQAADLLGIRFGAVDLIRSGDDGQYVLDVESDGPQMMIDRSFKDVPEFRDAFDFDRHLMAALAADE